MKQFVGQLYFSDKDPHVVGQITVLGVAFEITGTRISNVRTDITLRSNAKEPVQEEMFHDDQRAGDDERDQSGSEEGRPDSEAVG